MSRISEVEGPFKVYARGSAELANVRKDSQEKYQEAAMGVTNFFWGVLE